MNLKKRMDGVGGTLDFIEAAPILSGVALAIIGLIWGWFNLAVAYPVKAALFSREAREAPATITDMREVEENRDSKSYVADLEFQDGTGRKHLIRDTYAFTKYYALRDERNAMVRYLPRNPEMAVEIHSQQAEKPALLLEAGLPAICLLGGISCVLYGRNRNRDLNDETAYSPPTAPGRRPPGRPLA